jgi:hypothetical protein
VAVALGIPPSYFLKVCRFYRRHKTTEGGERGAGGGPRAPDTCLLSYVLSSDCCFSLVEEEAQEVFFEVKAGALLCHIRRKSMRFVTWL